MSITKFVYSTSTGDPRLIYDDHSTVLTSYSNRVVKDLVENERGRDRRGEDGGSSQIPLSLAVRTALVTWCILHAQIMSLRVYLPTLSSHRLRSPRAPSSQLSLLPRPFDPLDAGSVALEFLHRSRLISAPQAVPR